MTRGQLLKPIEYESNIFDLDQLCMIYGKHSIVRDNLLICMIITILKIRFLPGFSKKIFYINSI